MVSDIGHTERQSSTCATLFHVLTLVLARLQSMHMFHSTCTCSIDYSMCCLPVCFVDLKLTGWKRSAFTKNSSVHTYDKSRSACLEVHDHSLLQHNTTVCLALDCQFHLHDTSTR